MLGFLRKKQLRWDACCHPCTKPTRSVPSSSSSSAPPGQSPSRDRLLYLTPPSQHLHDRHPGPLILNTHHAIKRCPPQPKEVTAATLQQGQAGRTLEAGWACKWSCLQQARQPLSSQQGCFPKWLMVIHVWFTLWPSFKTFIETISTQSVRGALAPAPRTSADHVVGPSKALNREAPSRASLRVN